MRRLKASARVSWFAVPVVAAIALVAAGARSARAQHAFVVRPYLMDPQPQSMAVLFETSTESAATVTATSTDGHVAARVVQGQATFHEVVLDGLSPGTGYRYRVETSAGATAEGRFTTAPGSDDTGAAPVRMVVYGDSRSDAAAHMTLARAIAASGPDLVVHTGDMVEYGDTLAQWHEALATLGPAIRNAPLLPVLGNHELLGDSGTGLAIWRKYVRVAPGGPAGETSYAVRYGPLLIVVMDVFVEWTQGSANRQWLEQTLREGRATPGVRQIMVAMHHGALSSGYHGENEMLRDTGVVDVWRRGGVSLVFSGHDHDYERGEERGLKYVVTGGGGAPLFPVNRRQPYELAWASSQHYVVVEVSGDRVDVIAKRADGTVLDRCGFTGSGSWRCPGAVDGRGSVESTGTTLQGIARRWGAMAGVAAAAIVGAALVVRARRARRRADGGRA